MNVDLRCLNSLGTNLAELFGALANGEWRFAIDHQILLFGDIGRKWFVENERFLVSPHASDFYSRNLQQRFPVIMNFYPEDFHLGIKRRYSAVLGKGALDKVEDHFRNAAAKLFAINTDEKSVDLFASVARAVIGGQLELFFKLKADEGLLALLVDYEDLFSLGLYADAKTQELWYAQSRFVKAEDAFLRLYHSSEEADCLLGLFSDTNASAESHLGRLSHFYNLSVAGSTNVAKLMCTIVESAEKMGSSRLDALIQGEGVESAASHLIKEVLRLLPWTDNQITLPYLSRVSAAQNPHAHPLSLPQGSQIHLLHCLEHMSEKLFPSPCSFAPERWSIANARSIVLYTFGVGRRKCCGEALVGLWLRTLVEEYLKRCRFESESGISYRPYNPEICDINEFGFRGVFKNKLCGRC